MNRQELEQQLAEQTTELARLRREVQIEAALEKVRARTMGMKESSELKESAALLFQQVIALGAPAFSCGYNIWEKGEKEYTSWMTTSDGSGINPAFKIPLTEDPNFIRFYQSKQKHEEFYVIEMRGERMQEHYRYLRENIPVFDKVFNEIEESGQALPETQIHHLVNFTHGNLMFITLVPCPEVHDIFKRFGEVFEQTYTRFLDLRKAEAQAREAQIEAALERVRSKTMAMHNSHDVGVTVVTMFDEVIKLGIDKSIRCGIGILDKGTEHMETWSVTSNQNGKVDLKMGMLDMSIHPMLIGLTKAWESGSSHYSYDYIGDDVTIYYNALNNEPEYPFFVELETLPEKEFHNSFFFFEGILFAFTSNPLSEDAAKVLSRFAGVFGQTYRRYLDLQNAEAQAREAIKQASLDRIRGEIASMRTSEDLNRITPIIWRELNALEVPFIRCGVFIIDEENDKVLAYLTTPDGESLGVLNLPSDANEITSNTVDHWRKDQVYKEHWDKEGFINWTRSMIELGQVQNAEIYQGASAPPESLDLHFVPFTQGMLYIGDVAPLTDEKIELAKTLAEAFSIAYARYEDFKHLEAAKNKIEVTLHELRSAQKQLIQSEKMASLGELTAGIAHEIKNPLNFVNNFSEVSHELLEEMKEELASGHYDDAAELVQAVIGNLEKIRHHGRRADGIVRGMLQHSRGGSGEKEPTDINVLADEYLRLAYHGLRAKDKSFNAEFETDFDQAIPKINAVPQDIGRVLLNLINNAFYAVNERNKLETSNLKSETPTEYKPAVTVATRQTNDMIELTVSDNGKGIPPDIVDKIFQPFFTTKPTGEGTGLGLSLAYDIVTKGHGGKLEVETEPGIGTQFVIYIPVN